MGAGQEAMTVSDLVNHEDGTWKTHVVQQLFNPRDVAEILKIPLHMTHNVDVPMWRLSRNGKFSVKSAYFHLMEEIIDNNHLKEEGNWKRLWQIKVPNRVKLFMWRVLRGCLPVKERLVCKRVNCDNKCPCCDQQCENEWHCFFGCSAAQEVWIEAGLWEHIEQKLYTVNDFVDMIFELIEELDNQTIEKVSMCLWALWWRRNQKCWNDILPYVVEVHRRAKESITDWRHAQRRTTSRSATSQVTTDMKWKKPMPRSWKCNIDAACYKEDNSYCIGACLRDDDGRFLKAFVRRLEGQPEVCEAEALGLLEALKWLQQFTSQCIHIEMDCLQVIQSLKGKQSHDSEFGSIIKCCKHLLDSSQNCKVSHIRRQANRVAHELAHVARVSANHQVFDYCPSCIKNIILIEMQ
jgi:ribonuclease HI